MTTTSGRSRTERSSASSPSTASPATSMSSMPGERETEAFTEQRVLVDEEHTDPSAGRDRFHGGRGSARRLDEAEPTVAAAVDDRAPTALAAREQEEVVAEQLHLERGFLDVPSAWSRTASSSRSPARRRTRASSSARPRVEIEIEVDVRRAAGPLPAATPRALRCGPPWRGSQPALMEPAHLLGDLLDGHVERDGLLGRGGDALHEPAAQVDEDFAGVRVVVAARGLVGELDLDEAEVGGEALELARTFLRVASRSAGETSVWRALTTTSTVTRSRSKRPRPHRPSQGSIAQVGGRCRPGRTRSTAPQRRRGGQRDDPHGPCPAQGRGGRCSGWRRS